MLNKAAVVGRTLSKSNPIPTAGSVPTMVDNFTLTEVDMPSPDIFIEGAPVLMSQVTLAADVSASSGVFTLVAPPPAPLVGAIIAATPTVFCNGLQILREQDSTTVGGSATQTNTNTSVSAVITVSVDAAISNAGQSSVYAEGA